MKKTIPVKRNETFFSIKSRSVINQDLDCKKQSKFREWGLEFYTNYANLRAEVRLKHLKKQNWRPRTNDMKDFTADSSLPSCYLHLLKNHHQILHSANLLPTNFLSVSDHLWGWRLNKLQQKINPINSSAASNWRNFPILFTYKQAYCAVNLWELLTSSYKRISLFFTGEDFLISKFVSIVNKWHCLHASLR